MSLRVLEKLRTMVRGRGDRNAARIRRKQTMANFVWRSLPTLKTLLLIIGYSWMIAIPSSKLGQRTYIDENALQPGQVTTYWDWSDVHQADQYLTQLEIMRDRNASSLEIANFLREEFLKLGISSSTQNYSFRTPFGTTNGTNAYAVLPSPRASGTEAMIISASRLSRSGDGMLNLRGMATVLSLASYLKNYSLWAKDLIFVISDDYLEGMQAWITTYHETPQSNLIAEPLALTSGVIWTALNIDYPGHSFSHLGIFFEGLNGRLPNQDILNCFERISHRLGGVPVTVYDHIDHHEFPHSQPIVFPSWTPEFVKSSEEVREYTDRARNVLRHIGYQAAGQASGVHGLLHQFRIDAFTIFAVPAQGPHGFHALGRIVESTLRTMNNLLERLHASFFFYLLVGRDTFMKIGSYLPSAVLISTAMLFGGLGEWVNARWVPRTQTDHAVDKVKMDSAANSLPSVQWVSRRRSVLPALCIMIGTHVLGSVLFYILTRSYFITHEKVVRPAMFIVVVAVPLIALLVKPSKSNITAPQHMLLKSLNLCLAATVTSIISVLNFSLAAASALTLGLPLLLSSPSSSLAGKLVRYSVYAVLAVGWLLLTPSQLQSAIWNWEVLGVWFAPFVCIVYTPLVLQAGIVCLLPA